VVILGVALVIYARATAPAQVGPFLQNASGTKKNTHWHAALGVYDCDHWMGDTPGSGIWNWPNASASNSPSRASNPSVYAGLHSHDDGVIHMEPVTSDEAGRNATVGTYFDFGGWKLSSTGYSFLGTTVKNGDKCGNSTGTLQWEVGKWNGTNGKQKYTVQTGNPGSYKLFDGDIVVIAFLPQGKSIASLGDPPSVKNLANALNVETAPRTATATTVPPIVVPTTKPATGTTATPGKVTPTTTPKP
jgi:cell division septation protein DedD